MAKEIKVTIRELLELLPTKTNIVIVSGDTLVYKGDAISLVNLGELHDTEVHMIKIPDKQTLWIII